jgi:hypothetical protein
MPPVEVVIASGEVVPPGGCCRAARDLGKLVPLSNLLRLTSARRRAKVLRPHHVTVISAPRPVQGMNNAGWDDFDRGILSPEDRTLSRRQVSLLKVCEVHCAFLGFKNPHDARVL